MNAYFSFFQKRIGGLKLIVNICGVMVQKQILNIVSISVVVIISR
jgi:hypothetical protein